jgi:hypothetical protein
MDCKHVNEHLIEFLYQELESDQMDQIESHLQSCEGCSQELAAFESTRQLMRELPELEPSSLVTNRLMQEAVRSAQPDQPGLWERLTAGLRMMVMHPAMTAAVVLVVVLGISFYAYRQTSPPTGEPVPDDLPPIRAPAAGHIDKISSAEDLEEKTATVAKGAPAAAPGITSQTEGIEDESRREDQAQVVARGADYDSTTRDDKDRPVTLAAKAKPTDRRWAEPPAKKRSQVMLRKGPPSVARQLAKAEEPKPRAGKSAALDDLFAKSGTRGTGGIGSGRASTRYRPKRRRRPRKAKAPSLANAYDVDSSGSSSNAFKAPSAESVAPQAQPAPSYGKGYYGKNKKMSRAQLAQAWAIRGNAATKAGKCELALSYYNQALALNPKLRKKLAPMVNRCVGYKARQGQKAVAKAQKQYPKLAGMLEAAWSQEREAQAKMQNIAPPTKSPRAARSARRTKKTRAKAKRARPAKRAAKKRKPKDMPAADAYAK